MDTKEAEKEEIKIMTMADEMAEAATNFRGQGYSQFIAARDRLKDQLRKFTEQIKRIV